MLQNTLKGLDTAFIQNLLDKMTLQEKIGQMFQAGYHESHAEETLTELRNGRIGSFLTLRDRETAQMLQRIAVEETRLGIPLIFGKDVIHGYKTMLPIPLGQACSWNPELIRQTEEISAREALAEGIQWNFNPMVDICREPRWGRIAEGAGEDPYLGRQIAAARVQAYQDVEWGNQRMAACVKHYVGYGKPYGGKDYNSVDMSERELRDIYLPPFKAALDAGCLTLMTAFHDLNGIPATANKFILKQILREEWGFDGVVVSDFDAIGELIHHRVAADHKEATLLAAEAKVDMDMMGMAYPYYLEALITEGKISESWIDEAVRRILALKLYCNLFEQPYTMDTDEPYLLTSENLQQVRKLAEESIVLLKNENKTLPLQPAGKKIAVLGPLADSARDILGTWTCNGDPEQTETILEALQRKWQSAEIQFVSGCEVEGGELDEAGIRQALEGADICLMILGESAEMSGEAHNRAIINLPGNQPQLVALAAEYNLPKILVVASGRPLVLTAEAPLTDALLLALHGGTAAGEALVNVLDGSVNPAGKLVASLPLHEGQIPVYYAHNSTGRPVDHEGTIQFNWAHKSQYRDISNDPLYRFGYGLSYTTFVLDNFHCERQSLPVGETLTLRVDLRNTGELAGQEVVQLYIRDKVASMARPVRELKGFQKVTLAAGETRTLTFELDTNELGFHGQEMQYNVEPGEFDIFIGSDSTAPHLGSFSLT